MMAADPIAAFEAGDPSNPTTKPPIMGVSYCHSCSVLWKDVVWVVMVSSTMAMSSRMLHDSLSVRD
jgi:hypothetical protein